MHKDIKILNILGEIEEYRMGLDRGELTPGCTDHTIRICEAIVAKYLPSQNRSEWERDLKEYGHLRWLIESGYSIWKSTKNKK